MRQRHLKPFQLLGTVFLIVVQTGCDHGREAALRRDILDDMPHRLVTIASVTPGASNPCEVNYPVTLLRIGKHHTISWAGSDHAYWVQFNAQSPIGVTTVSVPNGHPTTDYPITITFPDPATTEAYFTYSIYDTDPSTTPPPRPCKKWDDDRDTGVNVKR